MKKQADIKLTPKAKGVIRSFLNKESNECKLLKTDGKVLSGKWLGGSSLAFWEDNKVKTGDIDSRSKQTVVNALKKLAPGNIIVAKVNERLMSVAQTLEKEAAKKKDKNPTITGVQLDELSQAYKAAKQALMEAKQAFNNAKKSFEEGRALWNQLNDIIEEG